MKFPGESACGLYIPKIVFVELFIVTLTEINKNCSEKMDIIVHKKTKL